MVTLAELVAAWVAVSLTVDGLRKLPNADAFARWLRSGGLPRLANREMVYVLAAIEVAVGIGSLHPTGRLLAIGLIVLVTPVGAVLVRRTGTCACRGVVRSSTGRTLLLRNATVAAVAAVSLVVLTGPVAPPAVLAVGGAWLAGLVGPHLLLTRAPLRVVT
jgi:hypothetical protein